MFITDRYSSMVFPYFMTTHGDEKENLRVLRDFVNFIQKRHNLSVKVLRSDGELVRKRTMNWLRKEGITFEPSAPRTQDQNGRAERSGGVIMAKARSMRLEANLPHNLWKVAVNCAAYVWSRTPRYGNGWKPPYEI